MVCFGSPGTEFFVIERSQTDRSGRPRKSPRMPVINHQLRKPMAGVNGQLGCSPLLAPAFAPDGVGQVAGTRAEKQERTDKKIHGHRRISGFHFRYSRLAGLKTFGQLDL